MIAQKSMNLITRAPCDVVTTRKALAPRACTLNTTTQQRQVAQQAAPAQKQGDTDNTDIFDTNLFSRALKGKSFLCTECGKCCTGSGEVWVSSEECERISSHLNMPVHKFYQMYTKSYYRYDGWRLLKAQKNETLDCIFLKEKLCTIHPVRPRQCSTYPWWPDLMGKAEWNQEKEEICEGFDHPDAKPLDEETLPKAVEQLKLSMRDNQMRMMSNKKYAKAKPESSGMDLLESTVREQEMEEELQQLDQQQRLGRESDQQQAQRQGVTELS